MILSKDLQEILEGVHYFLAEALTRESLSGRAECLRRGLVLQLEALTGAYPTLRICPAPQGTPRGSAVKGGASSASLPYLPMDQAPVKFAAPTITTTTTSSAAYSSSSSGVNSSSSSNSGSSGDGQRIGPGAPLIQEGSAEDQEETYEEFDEYKDEGVDLKPEKGGGGGGGGEEVEEKEEEDGVYTETHDPVPFSSLIATCERHGALGKKTKGLLRNIKSYLCVVAGGMLYLYIKETDDRQKKSIDLSGYTARSATGEDIKDTKKKDAAFEIVCPGRKTHTFIARTAKDKNEWLDALSRTMRGGKTRPNFTPTHAPQTTPMPPTHISLPLRPPSYQPAPPPGLVTQEEGEEYCLYNDVEEEELYEEIQGEDQGGGLSLPPPPSSLLSPSPIPHAPPNTTTTTTAATQPAYDPVDAEPPPAQGPPPPRPPPPTRHPQPTHTQADTQKDGEDSDDSQGIYCEIEDDVLENARRAYDETTTGADKPSGILNAPVGPFKPPAGGLGSLSKEIFKSLDATTSIRPQGSSSGPPSGPPRLPPKGVPTPEAEESEYKVPLNSDTEYHVPSSTPVSSETPKPGHKISGPLPTPNLLPVSQTPTILPIKPSERRTSVTEDKKTGVSSFRSGNQDPTRGPRAAGGTSVRDMIARLNQKKPETEEEKPEKEEEKSSENASSVSTSSSVPSSIPSSVPSTPSATPLSLPKQNLKPEKPPLPSRPPNLRAGGSVSPLPPEKKEEEEEEEEEWDEVYEVLDDDAPPQQQAEWYIAKFAFVATLDQALSFGRGDELLVYDTSGSSGWWRATLRGRSGLVPREYLKKKD